MNIKGKIVLTEMCDKCKKDFESSDDSGLNFYKRDVTEDIKIYVSTKLHTVMDRFNLCEDCFQIYRDRYDDLRYFMEKDIFGRCDPRYPECGHGILMEDNCTSCGRMSDVERKALMLKEEKELKEELDRGRTGVFIEPGTLKELNELWDKAMNTPVIMANMGGPDMASSARSMVIDRMNKLAKEKGLPDIDDNYGIDPETGEFLKMGE